jgi:hypothetical protein
MRVVVPTWTVDESKGGIRTFLCSIVDALLSHPDLELTLLCSAESRVLFERVADRLEIIELAPRGGSRLRPLAEQLTAARIGSGSGDVLLTPSNGSARPSRSTRLSGTPSPRCASPECRGA